jgi:hypothetical protein
MGAALAADGTTIAVDAALDGFARADPRCELRVEDGRTLGTPRAMGVEPRRGRFIGPLRPARRHAPQHGLNAHTFWRSHCNFVSMSLSVIHHKMAG